MNNIIIAQVEELAKILINNNQKLAVSESCTGGMLAQFCTHVSGSSSWFDRGFVTYSNQAKTEMLGVRQNTLKKFGAVSAQTVIEMAEGTLNNSNSYHTISISGVAGPTGSSTDKPVGTVYFGFANKLAGSAYHCQQIFKGNRHEIRQQSCLFALSELLKTFTQ